MNRLPLLLLLAACARASTPAATVSPQGAPAAASAPARMRRCAELADSTSRLPVRALPEVTITNLGRLDSYPSDIRDRVEVRGTFRVRPDGTGDAKSLQVVGSSDRDFAAALGRAIEQMHTQPARREGCPVWAKGDYRLKIKTEVRVRRGGA